MARVFNLNDGVKVNVSALLDAIVFFLYPSSLVLNFYGFATTLVNVFVLALGCFSLSKLVIKRKLSAALIFWLLFVIINFYYYLFYQAPDPRAFGKMASTALVGTTFFTFFFLSMKGGGDRFMLKFFYFVLLVAVLLHLQAIMTKRFDRAESDVVVNTSYIFAYLIPFVFFIKNRAKELQVIGVILFMLVLGSKRGAILVGFIGMVIWFLYSYVNLSGGYRDLLNRVLMALISITVLALLGSYLFATYDFVGNRMIALAEGEGGSGRDLMFRGIYNGWLSSESVFNKLFGFGFSASRSFSGNGLYAHNDWLESLINFGLLGVLVYGLFWLVCLKVALFSKVIDRVDRFQLLSVISICLLASMFSMVYSASGSAILSIALLGYLVGKSEIKKT